MRPIRFLPPLALAAAISMAAASGSAWLRPVHAATEHGHDHAPQHAAELRLDEGRKWATDEPLRRGMRRIRQTVAAVPTGARGHQPDPARPAQAAALVQRHVADIVANCRLEPEADAVLHVLLERLLEGAEALGRPASAARGLQALRAALDDYPRFFEHPGWERAAAPRPRAAPNLDAGR